MSTPTEPNPARPRVLVVDDVSIVAEAVARMLRQGHFDVETVASADAALAAFEADPSGFDVLLSDVQLGGMTGFELARVLRSRRPELPIVFMSAYVDDQDAEPPFGAPLVPKPFTRSTIILTVARALDAAGHGPGAG